VTVPVVEITLTGQELGQLVLQTRRELGIVRPKIGLVGFRNMFCDMSSFDALYEIELHEYFVADYNQLENATRQAYSEGMDAIIGGEVVCQCAEKMGRPAFFLVSGEESIAEAFRVAEQVSYAIDLEKKNTTLFKTLLDYSFNGIIKINRDGEIEHVNHLVERLLGIDEREMQGKKVTNLLPAVDENLLEQVLRQGEEIFSTVLTINKTALVTNIVPLVFENEIQGAIISFHEGKKITEMEAEMRREMYRAGHVAKYTFDTIVAVSGRARETMELAKTYAKFNAPVLILGENGTEKEMLAQCIHNASVCSGDPFVSISCDSLPPDDLCEWIFGTERPGATPFAPKGLVDMAEGGVLFLDNISRLNDYTQYRLYRLVSNKAVIRSGDPTAAITCTSDRG
jgi:transcriptional regulator with PAS, ATPase and Fis domain